MLQSMTGYGEAVYEADSLYYAAQIRTVNNKFLKSTIKLPESVSFTEESIEKLIRSKLARGSVHLTVQLKSVSRKPLSTINTEAVSFYIEQLMKVIEGCGEVCNVNAANLLNLPGVIEPYQPDKSMLKQIEKGVFKAVSDAIESLVQSRACEGAELASDLLANCKNIETSLDEVESRAKDVVTEYRQKLQKRVNELLSDAKLELDEQLLIREVAIFADRSDISEEISRLRSHLNQFDAACRSESSVGRKLDFLCQEMFREVNTIGSKAADAAISRLVVDMKCCIDRLKEQVQNVE